MFGWKIYLLVSFKFYNTTGCPLQKQKRSLVTKLYAVQTSFTTQTLTTWPTDTNASAGLVGVRLDKWMRKSSAMKFGLPADQTCGGQANIADWYLSCPTTECWERTDCFTVGEPARVQIPQPDILCQRSWFSSFHYQETERLLSLDQSVKIHKIRYSTKSKYVRYTVTPRLTKIIRSGIPFVSRNLR